MAKRPLTVNAAFIFILLNALIWLVLGITLATNALPRPPDIPGIKWVLVVLSMIMAGIILILFIFLYRGSRRAYYMTLSIFIFTAVLTIFDDVGWTDIVVLALNIIPIILLLIDRVWYLNSRAQGDQSV